MLLVIILTLLALDQATKFMIRHFLEQGEYRQLLPFLRFDHIENRGMAFGMLGDHGDVIVFVSAMVVLILIVASMAAKDDLRVYWPLALLVAGSSGNLIDRFSRGSVTDFIHFSHWPAFNLADIFIVTGVLLLIRLLLAPSEQPAASRTS
ncbi:MAG: signal peptidase II [Thermoleophilia bacterium]